MCRRVIIPYLAQVKGIVMFAVTDGGGSYVVTGFLILGFGLWVICRQLKKADPEGKVKNAAKEGLVRVLSRWLK